MTPGTVPQRRTANGAILRPLPSVFRSAGVREPGRAAACRKVEWSDPEKLGRFRLRDLLHGAAGRTVMAAGGSSTETTR